MTDRVSEIVLELAQEARAGGDLDKLIEEFAADYEIRADVLRARFDRAFPNGLTAAPPSEEEMMRRRREEQEKIRRQNEEDILAILDFFASRPALKRKVRENIVRYTGKRSCSLRTAKAIADRLES